MRPTITLFRIIVVLGMYLLPALVRAQSKDEINAAMATASFKKADAALNAAYRHEMQHVAGKRALKEAQLAWLKFRDAEAMFVASGYRHTTTHMGGQWSRVYSAALTALTQIRTRHLTEGLYGDVDNMDELDQKLNDAYKQLQSVLDDDVEKRLITAAELAWIKFRDAESSRFEGPKPKFAEWANSRLIVERTRELTVSYELYKKLNSTN